MDTDATHDFEAELSQPLPRPVRRRGGWGEGCGLWFLRLFLMPHTLAGIFVLGLAIVGTLSWVGVLLFGIEMDGRVVRKDESHSRKSKKTTYTLHYAYVVDGLEYSGHTGGSSEEYAAYKEGQALPLRVLPWVPKAHWVQGLGTSPVVTVLGYWFFALFWNGILTLFLWGAWIRPWYHRRLVRWGEPTSGIVREVRASRQKGGMRYTIRYEYTAIPADNEPEQLYHRSASTGSAAAAEIRVGDLLTVLYDPKRPKWSVPYKLADFEVQMA